MVTKKCKNIFLMVSNVYIYIYVCMYVCMYVCICICISNIGRQLSYCKGLNR